MTRPIDRRTFAQLAAGGAGAVVFGSLGAARAEGTEATAPLPTLAPFPRTYVARPLPFDPAKLKGLSARLLQSHHENNYGGAVKNLAKVEGEIAKLGADAPPFVLTGLKQSEHAFRNSVMLHELYFETLGGGGKINGAVEKLVSATWGSIAKFENELKAAGTGVGGGTGWVMLGWDLRAGQPILSCLGHNNQSAALSVPLLAMDVYEHAYAIDFGAKLKDYVEAFYANVNWEVVNRRLEQARAVTTIFRAT